MACLLVWIASFIKDKTADDKSWLIENDFYTVAEELLKESGQAHCDHLKELNLDDFFAIKKSIQNYINKFDSELSLIGSGFSKDCSEKSINPEWIVGGKNGLSNAVLAEQKAKVGKGVPRGV